MSQQKPSLAPLSVVEQEQPFFKAKMVDENGVLRGWFYEADDARYTADCVNAIWRMQNWQDAADGDLEAAQLKGLRESEAAAIAQRDELLAALKKYGKHSNDCLGGISSRTCTCGLDAAIAKADGRS